MPVCGTRWESLAINRLRPPPTAAHTYALLHPPPAAQGNVAPTLQGCGVDGRQVAAPTGAEEAGPWERSADIDVGTVVPDGPFPYGADMQSRGGSDP